MFDKLRKWDHDTFIYLNSVGIEEFDAFWSIVTNITTWIPLYLLIIWLFFFRLPRHQAINRILALIMLVVFVTLITLLVKEWVARIRPNNIGQFSPFIRVLKSPTDYSFFSGHASSSFAVATLTYLFLKGVYKWVWILFLWAIIFSLSRIFVGVHYPIDIIAGVLVGIASGWFFYFLFVYYGKLHFS
ncbi:phosphatase PAP2 family protein [Croceivirga thetidis]|uniref:Phosphatase PAP2 family protein n=1 Tax=Croceivirga thetidis TaxID=2721623 RepID=A0ABX1GL47_9FLAO|nr:phosphatase PAP2 family protein [Croceivirga thetidis]NKI30319.1 phosphatase PAP2 family protein [Croceivirga thetidis]